MRIVRRPGGLTGRLRGRNPRQLRSQGRYEWLATVSSLSLLYRRDLVASARAPAQRRLRPATGITQALACLPASRFRERTADGPARGGAKIIHMRFGPRLTRSVKSLR